MKRTVFLLAVALAAGHLPAQSIDLPAPQRTGGMPLMEALAKRSTATRVRHQRAFVPANLQPALGGLLASIGPTANAPRPRQITSRKPTSTFLLKSGAYVYSAISNKLDQVFVEDIRALGGTQAFVKDAPLTLVFVADLAKRGGNDEGARNTANIDVGYISQNVYLFCASEGLVTGARGSVDHAALGPKLKLRPDQLIVLAQSVGYAGR